jgi:hypothetical protein
MYDDDQDEQESGSSLRKKLEEALGTNKKLASELASVKAREVITTKGLDLVEPDDLAGVSLDDLEERAQQLQEQRLGVVRRYMERQLASQGLDGEDLSAAVEAALSGSPGADAEGGDAEEMERFARVRQLGSVGGTPVPAQNLDKLHGYEAIEAGLAAGRRK